MENLSMYFSYDELPVAARFLRHSFVNDFTDFNVFSSRFNAQYLNDFDSLTEKISSITYPEELTKELKGVTDQLYEDVQKLRQPITRLYSYLTICNGSTKPSKNDFGVTEVRREIRSGNVEHLLQRTDLLINNIEKNFKVLDVNGFTEEKYKELLVLIKGIEKANEQQNVLIEKREELVVENNHLFKELWRVMQQIAQTGKALYRYDRPDKANNYVFAHIKRQLRNEKKKAA